MEIRTHIFLTWTKEVGVAVTILTCMWSLTVRISAWPPAFLTDIYCHLPCLLRWNVKYTLMTSKEILTYSPFMATFPSYWTLFNPCSWNSAINPYYTGIGDLHLQYYGCNYQVIIGRGGGVQQLRVLILKNIYIFGTMNTQCSIKKHSKENIQGVFKMFPKFVYNSAVHQSR
jgi:hypothetical protein